MTGPGRRSGSEESQYGILIRTGKESDARRRAGVRGVSV